MESVSVSVLHVDTREAAGATPPQRNETGRVPPRQTLCATDNACPCFTPASSSTFSPYLVARRCITPYHALPIFTGLVTLRAFSTRRFDRVPHAACRFRLRPPP